VQRLRGEGGGVTRRRTPAEADALVAHLSPAERRMQINALKLMLRIRGVEVEEFFDAVNVASTTPPPQRKS